MIRIILLLLGTRVIQRRWRLLAILGGLWAMLGMAVVIDALDGVTLIRPRYFGYFILFEGILALIAAMLAVSRRPYRFVKAAVLIVPALVIIAQPPHANFIVAMMLGLVLFLDGILRIASAYIVRFPHWKSSMLAGVVELFFAFETLQPWPVTYEGTIGFNIGAVLMLSGVGVVWFALRLRNLSEDAPIALLLGSVFPMITWLNDDAGREALASDLVVHIWTPLGAASAGIRRPLVSRYIAAVEPNGRISTGHAALELAPDIYISHDPAVAISRSPDEFGRVLRAGDHNNLPGHFRATHSEEVGFRGEADEHIRFSRYSDSQLRAFWEGYRKDETYNLTTRNCSTAVAHALDAALEGTFGRSKRPFLASLQALFTPEIWAAGVLRNRAENMAWTPGLVLDYARLLQAVVDPPPRRHLLSLFQRERLKA